MARVRGKLTDPSGKTWHMVSEAETVKTYGRQFVVFFPETMMELARDRSTSSACFPVLTWAMQALSFERWMMLSQATVGEELGFGQSSIGRALSELEARGFLERRGSGPRQEWRLTPKGAWKGTAAAYQKERRKRGENPVGLKVVSEREPEGLDA